MISRALAGTLALLIATGAKAQASVDAAPPPSPFRYDDDSSKFRTSPAENAYARLKYISLGEARFLSLGADLRERVETSDVSVLGLRNSTADTYDLHRLLLYADLHLGPDIRAFAQIGNHEEVGRHPASPTDLDRLDLQQGFIDLSQPVSGGRATLRLGRAEMSYDEGALIGLRDGPMCARCGTERD
ncbi:MAG TPA: alginate export family protein [Sphingomicrobium sp.]